MRFFSPPPLSADPSWAGHPLIGLVGFLSSFPLSSHKALQRHVERGDRHTPFSPLFPLFFFSGRDRRQQVINAGQISSPFPLVLGKGEVEVGFSSFPPFQEELGRSTAMLGVSFPFFF